MKKEDLEKYQKMSIAEAFLALDDLEDEEIPTKKVNEGKSFDLRNEKDIEAAQQFRDDPANSANSVLEVIDVDADTVNQLKDPTAYVGKMLIQCNACKDVRFIAVDALAPSEADPDLYNVEDECTHCHSTGSGFSLIGQVGKKPEAGIPDSVANPETPGDMEEPETEDEAAFTNDEANEESNEDSGTEGVNVDDLLKDNSTDEDSEATEEEAEQPEEDEEDKNESYMETEDEDDTEELNEAKAGDIYDADDVAEDDTETIKDDVLSVKEDLEYNVNDMEQLDPEVAELDAEVDSITEEKEVNEEVDMADWSGSVEDLISNFSDFSELEINIFNKNGSKIETYQPEELPFTVKSQLVDTFNTDANYINLTISKDGSEESTKVGELFASYRADEHNETKFLVEDLEEDIDEEIATVTELTEKYADYYLDGPVEVSSLNIYIQESDLDTEVEPTEETKDANESLMEAIVNANPRLKMARINNTKSEEYFINESLMYKEDLDLVYEHFIAPTNNETLIKLFKESTGYETEVEKFLREHNLVAVEKKPITEAIEDEEATKEQDDEVVEEQPEVAEDETEVEEEPKTIDSIISDLIKDEEEAIDGYENAKEDLADVDAEEKDSVEDILSHIEDEEEEHIEELDDALKIAKGEIEPEEIEDDEEESTEEEAEVEDEPVIESVQPKVFASVKTRGELAEKLNILQKNNQLYKVVRSTNENYRYDIQLLEANGIPEAEIEVVDDTNAVVPVETGTEVASVNEAERAIIEKIDRIANDIAIAIQTNYHIDAPKNLIVADIIQDLQLVGGAKMVSDLENTPINELTKQMYAEFAGLGKAIGDGSNEAYEEMLGAAVDSLDSEQFSTENIKRMIGNPRFISMARAGAISYVDPAALPQPRARISRFESLEVKDIVDYLNEYFTENYTKAILFESSSSRIDENKLIISGNLTTLTDTKPVEFTVTEALEESNDSEFKCNISNNLSEEVITYIVK